MPTAQPSPIALDCDPYGIVAYCAEHSWWRAFRFYKDEAWDAACAHEELEHPGDYRQRNARTMRQQRARHAAH